MRSCEFCVNKRKPGICFEGLGGRRGRLENIIRESGSRWESMAITIMKMIVRLKAWERQERLSDDASRVNLRRFPQIRTLIQVLN